MTGQYTLFFTLLAHDWSWVKWTGVLTAEVETGPLARALRVNTDQLKRYLSWLEDHGYMTLTKKRRGKLVIQLTQLSQKFLVATRPEAILPSPVSASGGVLPPLAVAKKKDRE